MALFPMPKWRLVGVVAILTFGLTSLAAVLGGGTLIPATFVFGVFILIPLIALLGEDLPVVAAEDGEAEREVAGSIDAEADPVEILRERYARGEVSQEEFESGLDRLLETEGLSAERSVERERELLIDEE
jgi:uncharacterized membrane protein